MQKRNKIGNNNHQFGVIKTSYTLAFLTKLVYIYNYVFLYYISIDIVIGIGIGIWL
jgi:hypothetical protein